MKCTEQVFLICPAYPVKGLDCWKVAGTKCTQEKLEKSTAMEKIERCRTCTFYITTAHKF